MSIVTGALNTHKIVESYVTGFKYLTIEEMVILYPYLTPLTHKAGIFKADPEEIRERVSQRFGQ